MKNFLNITIFLVFSLFVIGWLHFFTRDLTKFQKTPQEIATPKELPVTIVAAGDIACSPTGTVSDKTCHQDKVFEQIKNVNPHHVLLLGDIQYERGELANYQQIFGPLIGDLKNRALPAPGNHEYITTGASGYLEFWKDHSLADLIGRTYYSQRVGAWEILSLNSNCEFIGGCGETSMQGQWLKGELAKKDRPKCSLAFWHHPVFTSGKYFSHNSDRARGRDFWLALQDSSTDIVLNGHDHIYERFAKQRLDGTKDASTGIREFLVGTGGRSRYSLNNKEVNQEAVLGDTFGFLRLDLYRQYYKWFFVDENGQTLDSGTTACSF